MSAQCLLSKTEKAQISGQMQIICTGWQHCLGVLIGSLFHKKKWVLIGSLSQSLGVIISFGGSAFAI